MSDLTEKVRPVAETLLEDGEDDLYVDLANRAKAIQGNPRIGDSFDYPKVEYQGSMDELRKFGKEYFANVSRTGYGVFCGQDNTNTQQRQEIVQAFLNGKADGVAALTALLMTAHIPAAIAVVGAALIVKLFFDPLYETMCEQWGKSLKT